MSKLFSALLLSATFIIGIQLTACSKSSDSNNNGNSNFTIPNVSGVVATSSTQSMSTQTISSAIQSSSNILVGGTAPSSGYAQYPFYAGMMHFMLSKVPDMVGCLVEVLVSKGLVTTDGKEYLFTDSDDNSKTKILVNANGNQLSNFKIYECNASSSQTQYMGGELVGEDAVFTFKNVDSTSKAALSVSGKFDGTNWVSKIVTINALNISSGVNATYKTTQYSDAIVSQYSTQGTPDIQLYAKFALSGSNTQTYSMGAGSIKGIVPGISSSSTIYHWDATLADTSTASPFSSDVSSGSYLTVPTSYSANDISGSEVWDCQTGSATVLDGSNVTTTQYQEVSQGVQACLAGL